MTMMDTTLSYQELADEVFGDNADSMEALNLRADELLPPDAILWECDATTFVFSYVSESAVAALGYPTRAWIHDTASGPPGWCTRTTRSRR